MVAWRKSPVFLNREDSQVSFQDLIPLVAFLLKESVENAGGFLGVAFLFGGFAKRGGLSGLGVLWFLGFSGILGFGRGIGIGSG